MNSVCKTWFDGTKLYWIFHILTFLLIILCSVISSGESVLSNSIENYSTEDISNSSIKHIFRLSLESSEYFGRFHKNYSSDSSNKTNGTKEEKISARSLSRVKLNSKARKDFLEDSEETDANDEVENKVYDIGEIDLNPPAPSATIRAPNGVSIEIDASSNFENKDRQHPVSLVSDKNLPAAHIDDSEGGTNVIELLRRGEIKKRRKQSHRIKSTIPPASSLKHFSNRNDDDPNNVSLKAKFSSPETEESSSIELELSVNGNQKNNQATKIQFSNPYIDSKCVAMMSRSSRNKRAIMNVWSFSNGKLRLESQKQVPTWMLNGTRVHDGLIINKAEIPNVYSEMITSTLKKVNQINNMTLLNRFYNQRSGESIIIGRSRPIMLNYILLGDRTKTWKLMLDKTVDNYLRDYFLTSFGRARASRTEMQGQRNWRKMRQVLLNFMSHPDPNCQTSKTALPESVELEPVKLQPQRNDLTFASPSMQTPIQQPIVSQRPIQLQMQDPLLRQGFGYGGGVQGGGYGQAVGGGQYGFQSNGQWGQQQVQQGGWGQPQQQQQSGWGQPQQQSGWGWGDEGGGKKSKKKGKKNKKSKKGKKGKKCKKKKGKKCGGQEGWGWGQQQQQQPMFIPVPVQMQNHGPQPSKIQQLGLDLDAETIKQGLTLWGILALKALPIVVAAFLAVIIYLLIKKHHPTGAGNTATTGPTAPQQVVYATVPGKGWGWKRRTAGPMYDYYFDDQGNYPTTSIPNPNSYYYPDNKHDYNSNQYDYYQPMMNKSSTSSVPTAMKTTYYKPKIKQQVPVEYPKDSMSYPSNDNEYHDYETEYINKRGILVKPRTKQEEELMKILTKHKKETLDQLMEKWRLSKKQGKWW